MIQKCTINWNRFIMRLRLLLVCAFLAALPLPAAPAFTIDQVLSAPFPDDLTASPKGDAVAWVENAAGVRNIRVARTPEFRTVQVTKFGDDDGQEISEIAWNPD